MKHVTGLSAQVLHAGIKTRKKPDMKISARRHALAMSITVETEANTELQKVDTVTNKKVKKKKNAITVRRFFIHITDPICIQSTHHT